MRTKARDRGRQRTYSANAHSLLKPQFIGRGRIVGRLAAYRL